ncbi:hypothetical protein QY97_03408 [Bacillus thermotolerans]|uniref:Uncharacterized protein n=1 Tax=Bacillus thermotolerans TaxID=1221996 RepID=A0A0F5I4W1_BACTR|nr:hypothetical protein QY97_03408 [Bacillus thermotolerans]KKB40694.1 hypothetical protein QY95_01268 [Bacillus thermotolerans]KKB43771.1 hypothetical protein QY96_00540 [Bacillus thermotolerans]
MIYGVLTSEYQYSKKLETLPFQAFSYTMESVMLEAVLPP